MLRINGCQIESDRTLSWVQENSNAAAGKTGEQVDEREIDHEDENPETLSYTTAEQEGENALVIQIRGDEMLQHYLLHQNVHAIAGGERNKWRLSFLLSPKSPFKASGGANALEDDLWSGAIAFPSITNGVISSRKLCYIIRVDRGWDWACTLAITYDADSRTANAICIGLRPYQVVLLERYIHKRKGCTDNPLFLDGDRQPLDLVEFASKLTALSTSIVGVAQLWASQSRVRLSYIDQVLEAERQHNNYNKDVAQAQVQMVYSLTAQRDNELNLRIARLSKYQNDVSLKLSQFAVYEGRLNTRMAKQSLQYGTDMQVIAGVTLVFLPGTFVVTLFSASFWDFQPGNTGRIVSGWVWLYFLTTILLTSVVLFGWQISSRLRKNKLELPPEWDLPIIDENNEIVEKKEA
ncbi:hypothetical protein GLAREA_08371 [Glarea lozoyensis ATCC 20868]|uniref:Magnesium transport protein CorA, transmembrane region n=1 Tax=Glarea lozoyensis (strain ATCC 20868 / MF5171) TaxID=1116229 RepID=S3CGV2_GLAL2|nr:uncharacterized protein GLAREA_08371 [Glarea lozoyensis ATCC 20868]EPE24519.1 hypothetical protein GLAREA_08371 [Glarea lozoyensis ATCC 20868]